MSLAWAPETVETSSPVPEPKWFMAWEEERTKGSWIILPKDLSSQASWWQQRCSMASHYGHCPLFPITAPCHKKRGAWGWDLEREMMAESPSSEGSSGSWIRWQDNDCEAGSLWEVPSSPPIDSECAKLQECQTSLLSRLHSGEPSVYKIFWGKGFNDHSFGEHCILQALLEKLQWH